ncbi:hypothetical protein K458DRAFT_483032 [Lentithecium fluviatile CBS 122367]|uniref:Uncharacterized protein n=1 Tax=Lentithecium fluviatile CBS 122367 TaxID=1168545 RepID=A0A6G1JKC5_9PLEO|nr:hypothetical protein K458DRAFT_483032 [Lentithecium fluviatile CBS 122367]
MGCSRKVEAAVARKLDMLECRHPNQGGLRAEGSGSIEGARERQAWGLLRLMNASGLAPGVGCAGAVTSAVNRVLGVTAGASRAGAGLAGGVRGREPDSRCWRWSGSSCSGLLATIAIQLGPHSREKSSPARRVPAVCTPNMFRRPGYNGRSKASADTLCQKCLKRGHYSYECKASAQERPYKSRPSRTQQLLNPQLKPKPTTEVPNDLLGKKGVADEILAKKEEERGKTGGRGSSRKRSRSVSSYSDDSVSTISTNRSPSRSRSRSPKRIEANKPLLRGGDRPGKRSRRPVSSGSDSFSDRADRNTRRRMSSFSPAERGRRRTRSRSRSSHMDLSHDGPRRKGRRHRSRSRSRDSYGRGAARRFSISRSPSRSPNRMETIEDHVPLNDDRRTSPGLPRRWGPSPGRRRTSRSRSRSPYRRQSPSPYTRRRAPRSPSPYQNRNGGGSFAGRRHQFNDPPPQVNARREPAPVQPAPQRERSLSPFSKRVALTKALQAGR